MEFSKRQLDLLQEHIDEAQVYIDASLQTSNPNYVLKAINDEIKANGVDWQYELNAKGKILQNLYEEIFQQNEVKG